MSIEFRDPTVMNQQWDGAGLSALGSLCPTILTCTRPHAGLRCPHSLQTLTFSTHLPKVRCGVRPNRAVSSNELSVNVESNSEKALHHCSPNEAVPTPCKDAHLGGKAQMCGSEKMWKEN